MQVKVATLNSAITASVLVAAAIAEEIAGAKSVGIQFTEGGTVNNRSGVLAIYLSYDGGSTFVLCNMLIDNLANTNSQNLTRVASKTRAAAGTDVLFIDPAALSGATHIKAQVDITDGAAPTGSFTVVASITY
jgi:hypothetical protein